MPAKKSAAVKKNNKYKISKKQNARNREINGIIMIAFALVLFISLLFSPQTAAQTGDIGAIGLFLVKVMKILAGMAAVIFPISLLISGFISFTGRNKRTTFQGLGLILCFFAFLALLHINQPMAAFADYIFVTAWSGVGGGVLGALISFFLLMAFGKIPAIIILLSVLIVGLILLTERSLFAFFKKIKAPLNAFTSDKSSDYEQKNEHVDKAGGKKQEPVIILGDEGHSPLTNSPESKFGLQNPKPNQFTKDFMPSITGTDSSVHPEQKINSSESYQPQKTQEEKGDVAIQVDENDSSSQDYTLPPVSLLPAVVKIRNPRMDKVITDSIAILEQTLDSFGVKAKVVQVVRGPAVTRYELQPAPGVKVSRITSLTDDIALSLAASDVRIEAPIPGKSAIGIEVPRKETSAVYFRESIEGEAFRNAPSKLSFALGKNIGGEDIIGDLTKMPHLLIAGATGSGKSICINSVISSFLYKAKPTELKLLLIDPKKVELTNYSNLPHLMAPVVTDSKKAANYLKFVVNEMENRYTIFAACGVKDFERYNERKPENPLPYIVVVIDELADLMMVAAAEVEDSICRLAQMARAAGIHLLVATQRPSVDVITGLIKANIPSRIAFAVSSNTDSRTILDMAGAEKLLGKGDMLYHPVGATKPIRIQGTYIGEKEIKSLVDYCSTQGKPRFSEEAIEIATTSEKQAELEEVDDNLFYDAARMLITTGQASTSFLQRRFRIGNPRAGRLIDIMEQKGIVSGPDGSKPRNILVTIDEFEERFGSGG